MKKYIFRVYPRGDEDGFSVWESADSEEEATRRVKEEYSDCRVEFMYSK